MAENENMSSKQLEDSVEPSVTSSPVNTDADAVKTSAQSRHDLVKKTHYVYIMTVRPLHTASFWNIIIHWTSHDDLTEKCVSLVSIAQLVICQKFKTALYDLTKKKTVAIYLFQV